LGAILVGVVDTLGRALLPRTLALFLAPADANGVAAALASVAIYLVMTLVLVWRPKGLFPLDA
jgi:branched-chain amino acid transport system permease protein